MRSELNRGKAFTGCRVDVTANSGHHREQALFHSVLFAFVASPASV